MNLIATADFANGARFSIFEIKAGKRYAIRDDRTGEVSYAGTAEKAWSSVRYMARVSHKTERSARIKARKSV